MEKEKKIEQVHARLTRIRTHWQALGHELTMSYQGEPDEVIYAHEEVITSFKTLGAVIDSMTRRVQRLAGAIALAKKKVEETR